MKSTINNHQSSMMFLLAAALLVSGCAKKQPPPDPLQVPPLPPPKTTGSLWQEENGRAYLYEDLRAMRVGDLITVKIVEKHKGSKMADTKAERDSSMEGGIEGPSIGLPGLVVKKALSEGLTVSGSTKSKFDGKGATNREDTLTGTMSAIVTEVLPNGDLRIEGRREVTVNSEKQVMKLSGIVRRVDVDTKNTVQSTAIADARIEYSGLGVVDDVQRPGWLVRVLAWIYPF